MIKIAYSTVRYGSSGSNVKKLQQELNKNGYKLDVDGKFGSKTQAAVRDYQSKNGLSVDGIVGTNTWGKLSSMKTASTKTTSTKTAVTSSKKTNPVLKETPRPEYKKSNAVVSAENKLKQWESNAPKDYQSKYSEEIESMLNDILNREKFSYNLNADPLYQQYRELYAENGKKAMMDTVGQASALTGGYANSYATTAGSQAYHEYLNDLNGVALDLRDRAYEQYNDEGDKLLDDITLLRSLDGDDYEKYLGELERYYSDGEYLLNRLTSMSDAEYEQFVTQIENWENDRKYNFDKYTDALDREEFETEMAFKAEEAQRDQANADRDYALALQKASSSGSSGSGSSSSKSSKSSKTSKTNTNSTINYPSSYKEFYTMTGYSGVMTENEYNSHDAVKKKYGSYQKYLKAMYKKYKNK